MDLDTYIDGVFPKRRFFEPRRDRLALRAPELGALVQAFLLRGYHELVTRSQPHATRSIDHGLPSLYFDAFDGDCSYAKYVRLRLDPASEAFLVLSYVAPVYSLAAAPHTRLDDDDGIVPATPPAPAHLPPAARADVLALAHAALAPFGLDYLDWLDPALDERRPMDDLADATRRDLLFHHDLYR